MSRVANKFSVDSYLEARAQSPNFVMVEYGYRENPAALVADADFTNNRAYIGVDAHIRDPIGEASSSLKKRLNRVEGQNVFFVDQDLGGTLLFDDPELGCDYVGKYDAQTILPDNVADEVFASNVLCDPMVADYQDRTYSFVAELARVTSGAGYIVLRETISPREVRFLDEAIGIFGLEKVMTVEPDSSEWETLERSYSPHLISVMAKSSYYMYLQKTDS